VVLRGRHAGGGGVLRHAVALHDIAAEGNLYEKRVEKKKKKKVEQAVLKSGRNLFSRFSCLDVRSDIPP
jgi:hypothetical protein